MTTGGRQRYAVSLLKLGFNISERTVAKYLRGLRPRAGKSDPRWKAFLASHREVIVAFDFFTVPTLTFKLLYCFLAIKHGRRKILHCSVTAHFDIEMACAAVAENLSRGGSIPLHHLRPRLEI